MRPGVATGGTLVPEAAAAARAAQTAEAARAAELATPTPTPPAWAPSLKTLAEELKAVGVPPNAQTINLIFTKEGTVIVTAGGQPLNPAQMELVRQRGAVVGPYAKGFDAEPMGLVQAGELGLTPTKGYVTNNMCSHCKGQLSSQAEAGGYKFNLSEDKKSYSFKPPE